MSAKADVKRWSMLEATSAASPLRLCAVQGYEGRTNDVVYCNPSQKRSGDQTTVVYFGGDMQDFTENMQTHRDSKNYLKWNLEDTCRVLHNNFADCHVVIIRPAKIEYKTFSCFKNFVPCNNCGSPEHTPMHFALQHLERILRNVSERLRTMSAEEISSALSLARSSHVPDENEMEIATSKPTEQPANFPWRENLNLEKHNLMLVGFSKGAVVLNQFLYEFHYLKTLTPDDHASMDIVSRIKDMYWLDGGHSGGKNTWITSRPLLETLTRLGINVHVHVSPYQIQDDRRPSIRKEEKQFSDMLRRLGAPVHRTVHFENMFPNLYMHFDIINVFRLISVVTQCSETNK